MGESPDWHKFQKIRAIRAIRGFHRRIQAEPADDAACRKFYLRNGVKQSLLPAPDFP
jgi:hypothetical protein